METDNKPTFTYYKASNSFLNKLGCRALLPSFKYEVFSFFFAGVNKELTPIKLTVIVNDYEGWSGMADVGMMLHWFDDQEVEDGKKIHRHIPSVVCDYIEFDSNQLPMAMIRPNLIQGIEEDFGNKLRGLWKQHKNSYGVYNYGGIEFSVNLWRISPLHRILWLFRGLLIGVVLMFLGALAVFVIELMRHI